MLAGIQASRSIAEAFTHTTEHACHTSDELVGVIVLVIMYVFAICVNNHNIIIFS